MTRANKDKSASKSTQSAVKNGVAGSLTTLATDYKAFKQENPGRAARVPVTIKDQARALYSGGETYSAIALACGLSLGSIKAWIDSRKSASAAAAKAGRKPGRTIQGATSGLLPGWVKIRVEGREVEVAKADFWDLLKGGLEAGK